MLTVVGQRLRSAASGTLRRRPVSTGWGLPASGFVVLYAALLLCVPSQLVFRPLGAPGTPANMVGVAGLLWWACATVTGQNPVRGVTPLRLAVGLLGAAVLASYANGMAAGWWAPPNLRQETDELWTLVPPSVGEVAGTMISAADRGLLSFAGWMGIVLLTAEGLRSWRDLDVLVGWLTWLGAFVAALGIVQFFTGYDIAALFVVPGLSANSEFGSVVSRSVLNRVSSTAVHPIEFGVVLAALFPLALHRCLHRWGRPREAVPPVLIVVACSTSVSRSAVLALAVGFVVLLAGWPVRWRLRALLLVPVGVVALRVAIPGLVGTIVSLFKNLINDPSVTGRTDDYGAVLDLYAEHAAFGRGLFTFVPRNYRILDNQYLMLLLELGLVGLLAFVLLVATAWVCARRVHHDASTARDRHLGLSLGAALAAIVLSFATFDAWGFPMAAGTSFLVVGMIGAAWRLTNDEDPRTPYRRSRGVAARGRVRVG